MASNTDSACLSTFTANHRVIRKAFKGTLGSSPGCIHLSNAKCMKRLATKGGLAHFYAKREFPV